MNGPIILVQAASRAWSGAPDWCMNLIDHGSSLELQEFVQR